MKDYTYCDCCKNLIGYTDTIYGELGNYFCEQCYHNDKQKYDLNKNLNRNQLFSTNKRDFYKDRIKWNEYAKKVNEALVYKYNPVPSFKPIQDDLINKWHEVASIDYKGHLAP